MTDHIHAPDPLKNHGYTDECSCGMKLVRGSGGTWVGRDELAAIEVERRADEAVNHKLMAALAKAEWMLDKATEYIGIAACAPQDDVLDDFAARYDARYEAREDTDDE